MDLPTIINRTNNPEKTVKLMGEVGIITPYKKYGDFRECCYLPDKNMNKKKLNLNWRCKQYHKYGLISRDTIFFNQSVTTTNNNFCMYL